MSVKIDGTENDLWITDDDPIVDVEIKGNDVMLRLLASCEATDTFEKVVEDEEHYGKELGLALDTSLAEIFAGFRDYCSRADGMISAADKLDVLEMVTVAEQVTAEARRRAEALVVVEPGTPLDMKRLQAIADGGGRNAGQARRVIKALNEKAA